MKKLELKHIASYLPYGLKGIVTYSDDDKELCYLSTYADINNRVPINDFVDGTYPVKPILRPLSDLVKEIEHNGEKFIPSDYSSEFGCSPGVFEEHILQWISGNSHHLDFIPFGFIQKLFEWHFDVFGLIDSGFAININTLKK